MTLKVGEKAPTISLRDQDGNLRHSEGLRGKSLVLFFYPKDNTPGCTAEACSFRDNYDLLKEMGAEVWGVSGDDEISHANFAIKNNIPFPLLVDKDNNLRKAFDVPNVMSILPGRVTFIIDSKGKIKYIFNNLLNASAHVSESIRILEQLKGIK